MWLASSRTHDISSFTFLPLLDAFVVKNAPALTRVASKPLRSELHYRVRSQEEKFQSQQKEQNSKMANNLYIKQFSHV